MARNYVRCLAQGHGNEWTAICIDFDIAVQAESVPAVKKALETAIRMYLDRVSELPEHARQQFLKRRSPLPVRLKYLWYSLRDSWPDHDRDRSRHFTLPGPGFAAA